jgi:asparaginyl-tRNA synthetase
MARPGFQYRLQLAIRHAKRSIHFDASVAHLLKYPGRRDDITLYGYIRSVRNQKANSFAAIGDGTTLVPLQAVLNPEQAKRYTKMRSIRAHI